MSNEQTEALAIDRAERFAKGVHCTPGEHDDIMVAVRLARKQLATPSPAPSDTLEADEWARRMADEFLPDMATPSLDARHASLKAAILNGINFGARNPGGSHD